ncbi:unnamed protein product, partial [Brachionus calyciflorus]
MEFEILDQEKTSSVLNGVRFKIATKNRDKSILWRCCTCNKDTFTTKNDQIMREPTNKSHSSKCLVLLPSFIESIKQYEDLKYLAKTNEVFNFAQLYRNKCRVEILENAKEYHIDGIFKFCPSIFKQIVSIHAVFKNYVLPCAYIFLESKDANTYIESLEKIRNNAFNRNLECVLSDFEMSLLISINTVFKDVEIKGCWFHYCQAIKRNLFAVGLKKRFVKDWSFRFWIRRILVLPLIQVEYLEHAFKIIIEQTPNNNDLEGFHSSLHKTDLRPHPNIDDMIRHLKAFDCRMRDTYLKAKSQEFYRNELNFNEYCDKLTHQMLSPYESILDDDQTDEKSEIESDFEINNQEKNKKDKKDKLINEFVNIDFIGILNSHMQDPKQASFTNQMHVKIEKNKEINKSTSFKRKAESHQQFEPKRANIEKNSTEENPIILDDTAAAQIQSVTNNASSNSLYLTESQWLTGSHIDYAFDYLHSFFNSPFHTINYWPTWRLQDFARLDFMVNIHPNQDHIFIVNVNHCHWILFTNLDPYQNNEQIQQFDNTNENQLIER